MQTLQFSKRFGFAVLVEMGYTYQRISRRDLIGRDRGAHVSSVEWLLLGTSPIALLILLSLFLPKRFQHRRKKLVESIDQLGHRLHERISTQQSEQDQESNSISREVLKALHESEELCHTTESSVLSSSLSSILPVKQSIAALSKRLSAMDPERISLNDSHSLNLASLAVVYVRCHLDQVIRVEHIANELSVTSDQLYLCLKESLGCSVQELIVVIKMQEAKKLLASGNVLVKDVAFQLGFWSPYHFSTRFKTFFGLSPKQYKKQVQERRPSKALKTDSDSRLDAKKTINKQQDAQCQPEMVIGKKSEGIEDLPPGTGVDRFLIVNRIGHGGMGVVYKAYDPKLNRGVALKLIRADHAKSEQLQQRLLREAQALARLSHPNVLHVYDVGTYGDQIFMTMALVVGQTLREWLIDEQRSIKQILKVMIAAGRGLSAAHKAGLVHRDFKPSNVIVGNDGQVRVLDFGLARTTSDQSVHEEVEGQRQEEEFAQKIKELSSGESTDMLLTPLTNAGKILGTPMYMAPEQLLGLKTDERTDQFGFCVVLYEALYGKRPFLAATMEKLKSEVIRQQVITPKADTDVPAWLWSIVYRGLSAKPDDRYPTLDSLLEDLDKDPEEVHRQKQMARRRKLLVIALVLLTIVLPIGVWHGLRYRTFQLCKDTEGEVAGVWGDRARTSVQQAFLGTKKSYAQGTWERVEKHFDRYLAEWVQMRSDVCEARLIRGTQSEELFDLRMSCLKDRRLELKALVDVFTKADSSVVQKAIAASSSLSKISTCANEKALRAPYPPPKTKEKKTMVNAIREKLAGVGALFETGKYREGLVLAKELDKEAKASGYQPLQAEVLFWLGRFLERSGQSKQAETTLNIAAQAAADSGHTLLLAKAMGNLAYVVGYKQARSKEGLAFGRAAELIFAVGGVDKRHLAPLLVNLGVIHRYKGDYDKALEYYRKAMEIEKLESGSQDPRVAMLLTNIGNVFMYRGEYRRALRYFRIALETFIETLGSGHPNLAVVIYNISFVLMKQGEYEKALEYARKVLTIREKTLGPEHFAVADALNLMGQLLRLQTKYDKALEVLQRALEICESIWGREHVLAVATLSNIGIVYQNLGRHHEAADYLRRVVRLCEKNACESDPYGLSLFGLARSLFEIGVDKLRAIRLAHNARKLYGKTPKAFVNELKEVDSWLKQHDKGILP